MSDPESDLIARCRSGDEGAWRELVAQHTRKVFGVAYRFVGKVDDAEDLTPEIFVKVYQSLDRYRPGEGSFATWIMTLARNHAIDDSPLKSLEKQDRARLVHRGLKSLPPDLREPLILCDLKGLPYEEIAGLLDVPLGTVKSRINRGRLELAKRLLSARPELARP